MLIKIILLLITVHQAVNCRCQTDDRWYLLCLDDKPAGYYHERSERTAAHRNAGTHSESRFKMSMSRLGSRVDMQNTEIQMEDSNGRLINILNTLRLSKEESKTTANIKADRIEVITSTGGKDTHQEIQNTQPLTSAEGIRLLSAKGLKKPGDSIVYTTFYPGYNMLLIGVRKFVGRENLEIGGKLIPVTRVEESYRNFPIKRELWLDKNGRLVKTKEPNPLGVVTFVLSNKYNSLRAASAKVELSQDQYAATIARSNIRLPQSRQIQSMTIKIKLKNPAEGFPDLTGPYQQLIEKKSDYVVLKIWSPKIGENMESPVSGYKDQFLAANSFLDKDDTMIINTVRQIIGDESDLYRKAILIRNWVTRNMKFNTGIIFAPSFEVIRNREGTCASYATLTATLCRAAGIPSRYLMGYVYADGIWGGHAWIEILVADTWVPIDAAEPSPDGIADAARFCFIRSSMNNGPGDCLIGGQQLYSNVDIEILNYTLDNKLIKPGLKVYEVNDSGYRNDGLGLTMRRAKDFEFYDTDKVFPENILFSMRLKDSTETVKVYQYSFTPGLDLLAQIKACFKDAEIEGSPAETTYDQRVAFKLSAGNKSAMAIVNGSDIFILVAKAKDSESLLEESLRSFAYKTYLSINS